MKPSVPRFVLLVAALSCALAAGARAAAPLTLAPDQLKPGDRAIVRTVFQGTKIEEFEAEIVGVFRAGRTAGDMILGRALGERVAKTGIAQGMSGSPVYVNGKLIGALSSGWSFTREPLFGITPIGEMLAVFDHPAPDPSAPTSGPSGVEVAVGSAAPRFREFRWDDAPTAPDPHAAPPAIEASMGAVPASVSAQLRPLALPVACAGLNSAAFASAAQWMKPFGLTAVPGGRAAGGGPAPATLEPGSAVAVELMRGDLQFAAIGTVTWRDGDRVLLFGHPFFQSGDVRLPLTTAEIVTIVASDDISFKLGVSGRDAGVATQDRRPAVAGTLGAVPRLMPLAIDVTGTTPETQRFRFETIEDRSLAPVLVSIAAVNSLLESGGVGGNQTLRWTLRMNRRSAPPLVISDVVTGDAPPSDLMSGISAPLRFLFNNPYERLALDSVSVTIAAEPGRDQWSLRGARILDSRVRPGGAVRLRLEVERWRGGREFRDVTLAVPEEAVDGRYVLWIGGSAELMRYEAQRLPGRYRPTSLDDAWRRFSALRSSDAVYAALFAPAPEVTADGRDYPELPISAVALLSSDQASGDRTRRGDLAKLSEQRLPLGGLVRGEVLLNVTVDVDAP